MPADEFAGPLLAALEVETARLGLPLTAAQRDAFARYAALLLEWNERAGLTTVTDPAEVARRHFGESLALLVALREAGVLGANGPVRAVDIGPGGGFPGLPMRIVEPRLALTMIETHGRRCDFLRAVAGELGLDDVEVVHARAEEAGRDAAHRERYDLAVMRAVAPLAVLVEYGLPLLRTGGTLAAPKGSRALGELDDAGGAIEALGGTALEPVALPLPAEAPPQRVLLVRREGALDARYPRRPGIPAKRPLRRDR